MGNTMVVGDLLGASPWYIEYPQKKALSLISDLLSRISASKPPCDYLLRRESTERGGKAAHFPPQLQ
jgi:hypothetical protein